MGEGRRNAGGAANLDKRTNLSNEKGKGNLAMECGFNFSNGQKTWSTFLNHENRESF